MPWKNGGGETVEIAIGPDGATLDGFDWRISAARVSRDGPFSAFPGIDRTLCVLDGSGIDLAVGGTPPVRLDAASPPFAFAADAACAARFEPCQGRHPISLPEKGFWGPRNAGRRGVGGPAVAPG